MKLKILAFDGEMLPTLSAMPDPQKSPIMLISFAANYDIMNEKKKVIFVLNRDKNLPEGIIVRDEYNDVIVRFNDERRMIHGWELLMKECDVITGYNTSGFDIPYIAERAKALSMSRLIIGNSDDGLWHKKHLSEKGFSVESIIGVKGKIVFDVLYLIRRGDESNTIKKEYNLKSTKLEWTAKEVLKKEKKEFPIQEMIDYWEKGTHEDKFINYCSVDSELALEFVTKFRMLDKFIMLAKESGKLVQDVIDSQGFGNLVENLLMKEFGKIGRVIPCRSVKINDEEEIEVDDLAGAFVLEPKIGITDDIAAGDYSSLYPSLMRKNNICYTTVITDNSIPNNDNMIVVKNDEDIVMGRFIKSSVLKGTIPSIQENLMSKRASLKAEMKNYEKGSIDYLMIDATQNAVKILLNTFYGFTGDQKAKLYYHTIAASVTGAGRKQIKYTFSMIEGKIVSFNSKNYRLKAIVGDTDSVYVQVLSENVLDKLNREIVTGVSSIKFDEINATLEKPMKLAFENYIRRMLVIAKKRYAMVTINEKGKELIIKKGIETVRRDWCDFSTDAMTNAIDIILHEDNVVIGTKKMIDYIRDEANKLRNGKIDIQKIILSKGLKKLITNYDNNAVHVKVAIKMKERGKPSEVGDRIQYIIMDNGKKLIGDKAEDVDYVLSGKCKYKIDYDYYINKQLFPPVIRILKALGVSEKLLTSDKKQSTVMELFDKM